MSKVDLIIGYIDSYGAIHSHACKRFSLDAIHYRHWPMQTHKLWRFHLLDWRLEDSLLSHNNLSQAEQQLVISYVEKRWKTS